MSAFISPFKFRARGRTISWLGHSAVHTVIPAIMSLQPRLINSRDGPALILPMEWAERAISRRSPPLGARRVRLQEVHPPPPTAPPYGEEVRD